MHSNVWTSKLSILGFVLSFISFVDLHPLVPSVSATSERVLCCASEQPIVALCVGIRVETGLPHSNFTKYFSLRNQTGGNLSGTLLTELVWYGPDMHSCHGTTDANAFLLAVTFVFRQCCANLVFRLVNMEAKISVLFLICK